MGIEYVVSACLAGLECNYEGKCKTSERVARLVKTGKAIPICPEQLGGLPTPRKFIEIVGGSGEDVLDGKARVIARDYFEVTPQFIKGAQESLKLAKLVNAKKAILKSRSPSCGCGKIYDGNFNGGLKEGNGVTAALFLREGIEVETEN
ncbi:DUF523 domain-containing protein [Candidatus Oleimmundimicrobium sp.]|uniref:DUF523 domain-containing protein n=1 Tax=Candidatus Oleimmundimicrobium sp. TaxID=3060597 RepID=UPI0027156FDD|nr:DUF523 domain-containing protein [Candidatus Oleimmundimicrobium sp.]MDO8886915.1 DUF523 domain-containing protein [Candidatus Oleimmundimicrobium sp.]